MSRYHNYIKCKVPLNKICYDFKDNIQFNIYYLMTKDEKAMRIWESIDHGRKHKRRGCFTKKYVNKVFKAIRNTPIKDTEFGWSTCKQKGQVLSYVPFSLNKHGLYYPIGGWMRVASAYVLGHKCIPGRYIKCKNGVMWKKDFGVATHHFNGMSKKIINKLLFRRKISNIFSMESNREDFLYEIPNLGFRGKYSIDNLINDENFLFFIRGKKLLNISLDNGWFDINSSKFAEHVIGYSSSCFNLIAKKICNYYNVKNCTFVRDPKEIGYFDLIVSNKSIKTPECSYLLQNRRIIYNKFGVIIYE